MGERRGDYARIKNPFLAASAFFATNQLGGPKLKLDERFDLLD
jgi:hypothetical protein